MLGARHVGLHRVAAGGDQDGLGRHLAPVGGEHDGVGIGQRRARVEAFRAGALDEAAVDALQPLDLAVLVGLQRRPVEAGALDGPAVALRVLEVVAEAAGVDEQLLGYAAADRAGAAEAVLLGNGHLGAVARRDAPGAHAARSAADDEEVEVVVAHGKWSLSLRGVVPCTRDGLFVRHAWIIPARLTRRKINHRYTVALRALPRPCKESGERLRHWGDGRRSGHLPAGRRSQIDAALLQLPARFVCEFGADLLAPSLSQRHGVAQDLRLDRGKLHPRRGLVEGDDGVQLIQRHLGGIEGRDLIEQLPFAFDELRDELPEDVVDLGGACPVRCS